MFIGCRRWDWDRDCWRCQQDSDCRLCVVSQCCLYHENTTTVLLHSELLAQLSSHPPRYERNRPFTRLGPIPVSLFGADRPPSSDWRESLCFPLNSYHWDRLPVTEILLWKFETASLWFITLRDGAYPRRKRRWLGPIQHVTEPSCVCAAPSSASLK